MTELNYTCELDRIENLIENFSNSSDIIISVNAWYPELKTYFNEHIGLTEEGFVILSVDKPNKKESISPTFYEQLLRQYCFEKNVQN
jgi:hypothetical protein